MSFEGKTVVVTGAASGIGAATATLLKSRGAKVVGVDRNPAAGVDMSIEADLSIPESIAKAAAQVPAGAASLCNIAGLPPTRGRVSVLNVNFLGLRAFTEAVVPKLANGASIVNLSSLMGLGWPQAVPAINELLAIRDPSQLEIYCDRHKVDDERSYFCQRKRSSSGPC